MKWNRFIFSSILLLMVGHVMADDSIKVVTNDSVRVVIDDSIRIVADDGTTVWAKPVSNYDRHVYKAHKRWASLIPRQFLIQNAGNMGLLSAGIGWEYGRRKQWETQLLVGFIPRHQTSRGKVTFTVKENFIPWSIDLQKGWSVKPLSASLYVNTVSGHEFWKSQPGRYPDKYYEFMSTKLRLNVAFGQQITWQIPDKKRKRAKSITFFYEVSSCDLYIRSKILDNSVPLKDILGLSLGIKLQAL